MRGRTMHVVFVADSRFIKYTATAIISILENTAEPAAFDFWIIHSDNIDEDKCHILSYIKKYDCRFHFKKVDIKNYQNLYKPYHITNAVFNKFSIPNILPTDISRALYLDSDVLVLGDLLDLKNIDLKENYLAAALDYYEPYAKKIGLCKQTYFNSGVMLLNLKKMRDENFIDKAMSFLRSEQNPKQTSDQDAFNIAAKDRWFRLDNKWNFLQHIKLPVPKDISIIHFTYRDKPWSILYNRNYKKEYLYYLEKSGYKKIMDEQLELLQTNKVVICTASLAAELLTLELNKLNVSIEMYLDSDVQKQGKRFFTKPVYSYQKLDELSLDHIILIASDSFFYEIAHTLSLSGFITSKYSSRLWLRLDKKGE